MKTAPIALFTYNRAGHLEKTLSALKRNDLARDSLLIVFSDGPKNTSDFPAVEKVRQVISKIEGFNDVEVYHRITNYGLSRSVIDGVTQAINEYGKIIVLEDDMITSKYFLSYMNDALNYYKNNEKVISIHAYTFPTMVPLPETFFLKGADCWGWGTWKRGWGMFNPDSKTLLSDLKTTKLLMPFNRGKFRYTRMLRKQNKNQIDSWAIRWHASAFLANKLTLYPEKSLIQNIGNDNSGTHCKNAEDFDVTLVDHPIKIDKIELTENKNALLAFKNFMKAYQKKSIIARLINAIRLFKTNFAKHNNSIQLP